MSDQLRVVIDAPVSSGRSGGVEQIVIGLAAGLANIAEPGDDYVFLLRDGDDSWLRRYLREPCRIVVSPPARHAGIRDIVKRIPGARGVYRQWASWRGRDRAKPLPQSSGLVEELGADVVHFPITAAYVTSVPSIYHPWDLQHVHFPQFFTREQLLTRELWYREFCARADVVSVATEWGKNDLVQHFGLDPAKIEVVPVAPVVQAYSEPTPADLKSAQVRHELPGKFAYFPAYTWPHKNHSTLIRAVALLRDRGENVHVVFSGGETAHAAALRAEARRLGLTKEVHFLGFVSPLDLQCLYRLATCLVFPSRFEGWGLPVPEAFHAGLPVASSNATCLPEVTRGAALLFDPDDVDTMAEAILKLYFDEPLRHELIRRGRDVVSSLSWNMTAARFRETYLRIARRGRES
jgi:glycosyltransferase involved in cell wall biosynthesis